MESRTEEVDGRQKEVHDQDYVYINVPWHIDRKNSPPPGAVKKTTSQNLWPQINSNYWINQKCTKRRFKQFVFENVTLAARQRQHFQGFRASFLVAELPPKTGVLVHKNSLASCQQCRHSVEPRALTCPFKQSNLSSWSRQNCRLQVRHSPCCTLFLANCFGIEMMLCDFYLKRFDLSKGLLFESVLITVW